jgi:hypothetical protein
MEHVSVKPFNKPYEAHVTMSAFSAKEVAVLTGNTNVTGLKIHPLKTLIASRYPQAEWDQAYIMAWQILTALSRLAKRPTTERVTWYWGIPYSPRSIKKADGEYRIPYIATSVDDEETLPSIWKHEHNRLMTMLKVLASPQVSNEVYDAFDLAEIRLIDVDLSGYHVMLQWYGKEGTVEHNAANAIFIRTALMPKGEKVQNSGLTGTPSGNKITDFNAGKGVVELPPARADDAKRRGVETRKPNGERTYSRGNTPVIQHVDDSPYTSRKGENAKRHDRRNKAKSKNRSKWDD